jgi:hypothetical protein
MRWPDWSTAAIGPASQTRLERSRSMAQAASLEDHPSRLRTGLR